MEMKVIEGTWEEVSRLGAEFAGRRVRVSVLDEPTPAATLDQALALLIREAEMLSVEPPDLPMDAAGEAIAEKFRRQGFDL